MQTVKISQQKLGKETRWCVVIVGRWELYSIDMKPIGDKKKRLEKRGLDKGPASHWVSQDQGSFRFVLHYISGALWYLGPGRRKLRCFLA